jgi:glucans biosynthesis protein
MRTHLVCLYLISACLCCGLLAWAVPSRAAEPSGVSAPAPAVAPVPATGPSTGASPASALFQPEDVERKARELAAKPYEDPDGQVPDFLLNLSVEQWERIRFRPDHALWKNEDLPFTVQCFHPGFIYNRVVTMHVVNNGREAVLPFSSDMFDYDEDFPVDRVRKAVLGFAGFRLHFPINRPDWKDEVAVFLGATYLRGLGRNTQYGLAARGVALNTALPDGEEFPYFREFWLIKPQPGAQSMTLYALMDSPGMTGVFRFVITPGTSTIMDVENKLFLRGNAWPQKIGQAPLTSMFLFSETGNGQFGDYRPEVHNSDGLLYSRGADSWVWSPLANPARLAVNTFAVNNPRGFGLMQRDNAFDHYQDIQARYDLRSSLWVEPKGDWGPGRLELIEIPATEDVHDNIVAFWVPEKPRPDGGESPPEESQTSMGCAYRLYWMAPGVTPHELGRTVATRMVRSPRGDTACFIIDFESPALNDLPPDTGLTSVIETPAEAPVFDKHLTKNPVTGGWRLTFWVRLPRQEGVVQSIISARDGSPLLQFRALLKKGENLPAPLTETWIYDMPS